jgi:hypothetical protein
VKLVKGGGDCLGAIAARSALPDQRHIRPSDVWFDVWAGDR